MSIRYAFDDIANYFSGPNMSALAQGGTDLDSRLRSAGTDLLGKVGSYGLLARGKAEEGEILRAATDAAATSALIGSLAQTAGRVGGFAMANGGFDGFGSGSTGGAGDTFTAGSVSKYGDAVQNPMDSFKNLPNTGIIYDGQIF